ncbi:prolipoprotein diacylglyceryl transferase [Novosphingobium pentaromativorans]|uniref:Phosphatidylglycerol--prolipoprotein diacylglyceryl transferase n=1 Tax=Novosphingobium pentaromativorans US6-1 TaxID=1088721 RepID=G6ECE6_9SPHN|nr:prolipoprotein diacylglyceryl transferase [Novosphingobium pentaromativorans]AIT80077.1 diacylglyceryl transferase [Novosphingobium pentaromativorans US6-1]EHJ61081.1 prolipoprotein diacylglyceryl transferase [Novosphingobium pentaromativorans US6-1]
MSLLTLAAAAAQAHEPIHWVDLGLKNYLFRIGSFELRWYSLAYLAGIVLGYWHLSRMIKSPGAPLAQRHADDLFFYCTLGIILGGRLGYATFYTGGNTGIPSLWAHPAELLSLWHGGMSFHGGLIGVLLAMAWVSWRGGLNFVRVADYLSVCVPFGMMFGRLANFVNGELWGRVVTNPNLPWAMVFPDAPDQLPRHPSQLYEAGLEGLLMIVIMLTLYWKTRARFRPGLLVGVFTVGIGCARFFVEFFREPDAQLEDFARETGLSMGQWLTIPLILLGLFMIARAIAKPALASGRPATA